MSEDMYSLLGKYFSGQATKEEVKSVTEWINNNEDNKAEFKLLQELWNQSGEHTPLNFDSEKAWERVDSNIRQVTARPKIISRFTQRAAIAIAASFVLVLSIWWITSNKTGNDITTILADTEVKEVLLEDGSKVYLRKGASLEFPKKFAANSRQVTLSGDAFFEVTPNPSKQFVIMAAETEVHVIGTSFSVNNHNKNVEVIVKTGKVQFNSRSDTSSKVLLVAGEKALFADQKISKQINTDPNFNAWQSKELVFDNTPLKQVAATLSNYYGIIITLKEKDASTLSETNVTAIFKNQSLPSILKELSLITSYDIKKVDETHYEISIQ